MKKTIIQIKISRINRKINDWINNTLCYPILMLERKIRFYRTKNKPVTETNRIKQINDKWLVLE